MKQRTIMPHRPEQRMRRVALALLTLAALVLLSGLAVGDGEAFGGDTQTGTLNSYGWCEPRSFLDRIPGREPCSSMAGAAPLYQADAFASDTGSPLVFTFEGYEPAKVSVSGLAGRVRSACVSGDRSEVAAPAKPGEYEVSVNTDCPESHVSYGFRVVAER